MARKNPDKAKEVFARLRKEILKYGDEGEEALGELFESHRPDVIFAMEQGPERQARAAQLIADMRVTGREIAEARYHRGKDEEVEEVEEARERPGHRTTSGRYDRFRYTITEAPDGSCTAKITRQARQLYTHPGAPPIVDHPRLRKPFRDCAQAELAVRRIINTALIWYEERGLSPTEKVRKTAMVKAGIHRRTPGQSAARERAAQEKKEERKKKKARDRQRSEGREARYGEPRQRSVESSPGRKITYIPRKNPSNPRSFELSESAAYRHGVKSREGYEKWKDSWEESLREGKPNFGAAMKAYNFIENARVNFTLAGDDRRAQEAAEIRKSIRHNLIEALKVCRKELSGRRLNPEPSEHRRTYGRYMSKMDAALDRWSETGNIVCLIDAYKYAELSYAEAQNANDTGMAEALKTKIKTIRDGLKRVC